MSSAAELAEEAADRIAEGLKSFLMDSKNHPPKPLSKILSDIIKATKTLEPQRKTKKRKPPSSRPCAP